MTTKRLSRLASAISSRQCALFAGAGLTSESGGATWSGLVEFLKKEFNYSSPLTDNFRIMGDMCRKYGKEEVYETVRDRLKDARIDEPVSKLAALPWFTAFTTNYDLALEELLVEDQTLIVRTIITGQEFALTGLQSELLCVKLMGSLDTPVNQPGSMVLGPGDLATATEERTRIFDMLASHAANISFLFVGYSFDDGIFLDMLERLMDIIGNPKGTYYAAFRSEPDEEKAYLLSELGVEIIVSDLPDLAEVLSEQVALLNPEDFTLRRIPLGSDVVPIDTTKVRSFLSLHNPVLFEYMEEQVSADSFLRGRTDSLKPFELGWHFPRGDTAEIVRAVLSKGDNGCPRFVVVRGNPGSGRTFTILAAVHELMREHRLVGVKISSSSINPIPRDEDMEQFMKELERGSREIGVDPPEYIVFWASFTPEISTIAQFRILSMNCEYPMTLLFEDVKSPTLTEDMFLQDEAFIVDVDIDLSEEKREEVAEYIMHTVRTHRFPEITRELSDRIIAEEKRLLPIMYRALDPARRSIDRIVQEEFNALRDSEIRACVSLCSLATSLDLEMPVTVLKKALSEEVGKQFSYPDVLDIVTDKAKSFIIESTDIRTNPMASIYHSVIAQRIMELVGPKRIAEHLLSIAKKANLQSRIEAEFVSNLFIAKGVNWSPIHYRPFDNNALERALSELKSHQPARPIIHHLARLCDKMDVEVDRVVSLLEEALAEPKESYALVERKENVLTTLAKVKWNRNKEMLLSKPRSDPAIQEIIGLLVSAREGQVQNIHPYDVHARILKELWQSRDAEEKIPLVSEAVEVLDEGLQFCIDDPDSTQRLGSLLIESLSELDREYAEEAAKDLLTNKKDGTGYYTLARIEYHEESNMAKASLYLDKALSAEYVPPGAIALKVEILLSDKFPDYDFLISLVDLLSSVAGFKDTWKRAFNKAVVYTINGRHEDAVRFFNISFRSAPFTIQRRVGAFWMENGRRKTHTGKVGRILTGREGRIYSHGIEGWKSTIFFDPRRQDEKMTLAPGMFVDFELGFSPRGPIAFDVRPRGSTREESY